MSPGASGEHGFGPAIVPSRYLTEDIPGIGGRIKERPEDFLVDEIPLYEPSGRGEHIYMYVEKRGVSTLDMVRDIASHFGVRRGAVGYAGLKDKHAITRQVISVHTPGKRPEDFPMLRHEKLSIEWTDLHENKLRKGHLTGNRFSVRIRGVSLGDVLPARRTLESLARSGLPNRLGEQRYGAVENNHLIGREIIVGNPRGALDALLGPSAAFPDNHPRAREAYAEGRFAEAADLLHPAMRTEIWCLRLLARGEDPQGVIDRLDESVLSYFLSAFQSAVFNHTLDRRVLDGSWNRLLTGDLAYKHDNGALFSVDEDTLADGSTPERLSRMEISPSGPMWGPEMKTAGGAAGRLEADMLGATGVHMGDLWRSADYGGLLGSRRPLRVPLKDPDIEGGLDEHGPYVRVAFELPKGSFATVALRESMKPERVAAGAG